MGRPAWTGRRNWPWTETRRPGQEAPAGQRIQKVPYPPLHVHRFLSHAGLIALLAAQGLAAAENRPAATSTASPPAASAVSFRNDVMPRLLKAGCGAGNCHAKPEGQSNFKLSVFGYDPAQDYHEIVRDLRGRRLFFAAPQESLLLRKATGQVPHEGGTRIQPGDETYQLLLRWIEQGAPFEVPSEPSLQRVEVSPPQIRAKHGSKTQLKVTGHFSDGSKRDVSALAEYLSQDKELAAVGEHGLVEAGRVWGEAVIVVRYMGLVDICRVTQPSPMAQPAQRYSQLPVKNPIDSLVHARLQEFGLLPSETCTDAEFLRRVSLDLIGKLPSAARTRAFLSDTDPQKRQRLIDELLEDPNYADHWAIKWGDLIRPNPSRVGVKPVYLLDDWLRSSLRDNKPYDRMVRELLTAEGSSHEYGPVAVWRDKREPVDAAGFISQIFLGLRLECAKCHHHPSEKWTQEDYYRMAAFFSQMKRKGQGISAPISGEPEYWWYGGKGEITHPITDEVMLPKAPDGPSLPYVEGQDPRAALADWMTSSSNPFFARAIVNRLWAEMLGRGIVEPVDDFRLSNPPSNEPLLNWLAQDFISSGFDLKHLLRRIANSGTYQRSSQANATNTADQRHFSRSLKRRLSAEVLADAVSDVLGVRDTFSGLPAEARAVQTWNHKLDSNFLDAFGRPNASQECPCERERKPSVVQALHLMNSQDLQNKISNAQGNIANLAKRGAAEPKLVSELYLAAFNRLPHADELSEALRYFSLPGVTRQSALEDLAWSLINSAEFVFNH